jgi:hypothetical protein
MAAPESPLPPRPSPGEEEEHLSIPSIERLAHLVEDVRQKVEKKHYLQQEQFAGVLAELGELSALVRHSEQARAEDMRAVNACMRSVERSLASIRETVGELAENQGRILAELAARARQDSIHEEAITGVHRAVEMTKADLALARAKWLGWRGLAIAIGWGALEAFQRWIGG